MIGGGHPCLNDQKGCPGNKKSGAVTSLYLNFQVWVLMITYNIHSGVYFYHPQRSWSKNIFSEVCVKNSALVITCNMIAVRKKGKLKHENEIISTIRYSDLPSLSFLFICAALTKNYVTFGKSTRQDKIIHYNGKGWSTCALKYSTIKYSSRESL